MPGGTATLAGRTVARIGFGTLQLEHAAAGRDAALAVLRQAVHGGVNHLDTAQFYGAGACNRLIRDALAPYPDDLVLVSKVGADNDTGGALIPAQRPEQLRDAGKIGGIGLSNVTAGQLHQALPIGVACVQNLYGVLDRAAEPVLGLCREHDIPWVPFFPLGSAFPGRPKVAGNPTIASIAGDLAATPAQVALAWLLAHDRNTLLIPGTSNPVHLAENIAAGSIRLSAGAVAALDQLAASS